MYLIIKQITYFETRKNIVSMVNKLKGLNMNIA